MQLSDTLIYTLKRPMSAFAVDSMNPLFHKLDLNVLFHSSELVPRGERSVQMLSADRTETRTGCEIVCVFCSRKCTLVLCIFPRGTRMNRLLLAGFVSRQVLPYLSLPTLLSRPELSTPITNYNRRQSNPALCLRSELMGLTTTVLEGYWLLDRSVNPYEGGSFHHSPLLLLLSPLDLARRPWLATLIWSLAEIATAAAIARIAQNRRRGKSLEGESWSSPLFVAALCVKI